MYGLVNASLKQLIVEQHGQAAWDRVARAAGLDEPSFNKMQSYPDSLTYQLVGLASTELKVTQDEFLHELGVYWVAYTAEQGYAHLFEVAGPSLRDFLFSLDELHARVGRSFLNLRPPSFRFDPIGPDALRLHYISHRQGLCPFVIGLLAGVSARFETPLQVDEVECSRRGADHCEFNLVFPP
jgi:Haem-NO-binding